MALNDKKKRPQDDPAFAAGAALRNAATVMTGVGQQAASTLQAPARAVANTAESFGRGVFNAPRPEAVAPAAPLPRPSFNNVVGAAATLPARNPASPAASAGAATPAGGVPAPSPMTLKPGDVNTFTGSNGVTRPVPGLLSQASGGGVPAQSFGGLSMPTMAAPVAAPAVAAPRQDMSVSVPRPVRADAFNVREANDQNKKIADTIQSELFRNSLAAGRGSRSARDAQASMLQTLAQLGGKQLDVAANVAGGDRDASVKGDLAGMEQSGANQRAVLGDTGATTRTGMEQAGANQRTTLQTLAELNKPSTITDANGNLLQVSGTTAAPVVGADGEPVKPAAAKADGAITPALVLDSLTKQLAAEAGALQPDPARIGALQQQISALTAAGNSPAAGAPSARPANLQDFMAKAKAANPNASDAQLQAYYAKTYGK